MPRKKDHEAVNRAEADFAALTGVSDKAVKEATGRDWKRWVKELDAIDATSMPHREIAAYIHDKWEISVWWAQTVTVGYERIRGQREIGQRRSGAYEANKSKTLPVPITKLYGAFSVARTRDGWLPGVEMTVRKATPDKSMRIAWEGGTSVEVYFTSKGESKSQVAIQHRNLATKSEAAKMKDFWSERLGALAEILTPSG